MKVPKREILLSISLSYCMIHTIVVDLDMNKLVKSQKFCKLLTFDVYFCMVHDSQALSSKKIDHFSHTGISDYIFARKALRTQL